jgi:hypothetical protein
MSLLLVMVPLLLQVPHTVGSDESVSADADDVDIGGCEARDESSCDRVGAALDGGDEDSDDTGLTSRDVDDDSNHGGGGGRGGRGGGGGGAGSAGSGGGSGTTGAGATSSQKSSGADGQITKPRHHTLRGGGRLCLRLSLPATLPPLSAPNAGLTKASGCFNVPAVYAMQGLLWDVLWT